MQGLKYVVTNFFNFDLRKKLCFIKADRVGKNAFFEVFRPYLDFWSEVKNSVRTYFALGYVEAV